MVLVFLRNFTQNVKKATGTETKIFFVAKDRKDFGKNRNIRWKQNQSVVVSETFEVPHLSFVLMNEEPAKSFLIGQPQLML